MAKYKPTIGLEIHSQLKTKTKMFCDSLNDPYETHSNINICPVCMGHPGTLPTPNKEAIEKIIKAGLALNCNIAEFAKFDRKNYFYPDLPKGYQISQYDIPFCSGGHIEIDNQNHDDHNDDDDSGSHNDHDNDAENHDDDNQNSKKILLERIHLEEDTGRLVHSEDGAYSYIDFNRAGIPLMELVTKPVIHSAEEARKFAQQLQLILRYLDASDADMEKGQMRVEVNLSMAAEGSSTMGTKVEIKNLNSLRAVEEGIAYEVKRQKELIEEGKQVEQQTVGWDEEKQKTVPQRSKEEAHDYRYFPEPDIPPLRITREMGWDTERMRTSLPELPRDKKKRFIEQYVHDEKTANIFVSEFELADFFERAASEALRWTDNEDPEKVKKLTTNYTTKNLRTILTETQTPVAEMRITAENFGELIGLVYKGEISSAGAREVLEAMFHTGKDPSNIVEEKGLRQVSDTGELEKIVDEVIAENEKAASDYKNGDENAIKFLMGQVMKKSKGSANPQKATELLKNKLE